MIRFFNWFTKITGWPIWKIVLRPKYYYEDKKSQSRKIKKSAILISNHTALFDYAVFLFTFFGRTLRYQMAEVLFGKKVLGWFLKNMGGIFVDRDSFNFSFIDKSVEVLQRGGVVGIFPESRLPKKGEMRPLPFKKSFVLIALQSNSPMIPIYTNGKYFCRERCRVIIGKPVFASDLEDKNKTEKENIDFIANYMRNRIIELGNLLNEKIKK